MDDNRQEEKQVEALTQPSTAPDLRDRLEGLYQRYHKQVFLSAHRITGNPMDAEDALQTVFMRLLRRTGGAELTEDLGAGDQTSALLERAVGEGVTSPNRRLGGGHEAALYLIRRETGKIVEHQGDDSTGHRRRLRGAGHDEKVQTVVEFGVLLGDDRSRRHQPEQVPTGSDHFHRFLKGLDASLGTTLAGVMPKGKDKLSALDSRNQLPREPKRALELIDRFLIGARGRTKMVGGKRVAAPLEVAVILDYAHFIAPQGDPLYLSDLSQTLIQILQWGSDPAMSDGSAATVLITENLADLNRALVESSYSAKVRVALPTSEEIQVFVDDEVRGVADFDAVCEVSREELAELGWLGLDHWEIHQEEVMLRPDEANQFAVFTVEPDGDLLFQIHFLDEDWPGGSRTRREVLLYSEPADLRDSE